MTPELVLEIVCQYNNVTVVEIRRKKVDGKYESRYMGRVRCIAVNLVRENFPGLKEKEIVELFRRDSRYDIRDCFDRFIKLYDKDKHFQDVTDSCRKILKALKKDFLTIEDCIKNSINQLVNHGNVITPSKWQSVENKNPVIEITDLFFQAPIPKSIIELERQCDPDKPWAENHFQERINPRLINKNPGAEYLNWPYYKNGSDFLDQHGRFSHTYMERFWPVYVDDKNITGTRSDGMPLGLASSIPNYGIRYELGDLYDIIQRLRDDPYTRQAYLSIWHPEDQSNQHERRLPCTLGYFFQMRNYHLDITYHIRSCDAARHFKNDIYMAARLCQWVCERLRIENEPYPVPGKINVWIGNFHCFQSDTYTLKKKYRV